MIYPSLLSGLFLTVFSHLIIGQNYDFSQKQPGSVIIENNDSLVGEVVVGSSWQSVAIVEGRAMQQVFASQAKKVYIADGYSQKEFLSLQTHEKGDFYFFEVLVSGKAKLLCSSGLISSKDTDERKYFITDKGYAIRIATSDKSFFNTFGKFKKEMRDYAFSMAMDLNKERDLKLLFSYFNQNYPEEKS